MCVRLALIRVTLGESLKIKHIVVVSLHVAAMCLLSPQPSAPQDLASPTTEKSSSPVRMATADTGKPQPAPNTATRSTGLRNHSLRFEVNLGQTDRRVKYLSRGPGYILFLRGTDAVLSLEGPTAALNHGTDTPPAGTELDRNEGRPRAMSPRGNPYALQSAGTLRITLLGTSQKATVNGLDLSPATSNYFIGNDPAKWRTDVPAYSSVRYRGIYQGTDLVYYGNQGQLESDFVLAPGADPSHIRLRIDGAQHLTIDPQGDMAITVGTGQVQWRRPTIYQEVE